MPVKAYRINTPVTTISELPIFLRHDSKRLARRRIPHTISEA
jgi:hypothetical protein